MIGRLYRWFFPVYEYYAEYIDLGYCGYHRSKYFFYKNGILVYSTDCRGKFALFMKSHKAWPNKVRPLSHSDFMERDEVV